jgi:hypothetical protein
MKNEKKKNNVMAFATMNLFFYLKKKYYFLKEWYYSWVLLTSDLKFKICLNLMRFDAVQGKRG